MYKNPASRGVTVLSKQLVLEEAECSFLILCQHLSQFQLPSLWLASKRTVR